MLFIKYDYLNPDQGYPLSKSSIAINIYKRSLQTQARAGLPKRKRASCSASCQGSVTVEAALVFPVFLCVLCGFLMMAAVVMTEAGIRHALARTADIYAVQKAAEYYTDHRREGQTGNDDGTDTPSRTETVADTVLSAAGLQTVFMSVYEGSDLEQSCIRGGRSGILLSGSDGSGEENVVKVQADYTLRLEIPFLGSWSFARQASVLQRIFTGYEETGGNAGPDGSGGTVYVTEHGSVYHTSLSCSHLCLSISGDRAAAVLAGGGYEACEKCITKGTDPSVLYVTVYGDKYHASLHCSGLKRNIKAIPKEKAEGMRMCSRCAAMRKASGTERK